MKRFSIFLLALLCVPFGARSHHINTFRLDHLTVSDGLPNSSVSGIVQDSIGFMWFGTQSGLTRYDGYTFKTYLNDPFDDNSLPHNLVQTMYLDENDILWLGTYNGLSRMDLNHESFVNYPSSETIPGSLSNDVVVAIERDGDGNLWVGTLNGLNVLDEETGTFRQYFNNPDDPFSLPNNTVRSIMEDNRGNLWIGTYGGLSLWNREEDLFINFVPVEGDETSIPSVYVMDIKQSSESDEIILLGTWGGGFAEFNTVSKKAVRYEIPDMRVYKLLVDREGKIWAGTWGGGISILEPDHEDYTHFSKEANSDLSHDIIYSLYEDLSGVVWIGTNGGGINKYVDWKNQYSFYVNNPDDPYSIPSGKVIAAYEDSDRNVWFSVQGKGISRLNPETGLFRNYGHEEGNDRSLSDPLVNAIFEDREGNLLVGTNDGLNRYVKGTDDFDHIDLAEPGEYLPENLIYSMAQDHSGNLWLGSYTKGLFVRSPAGKIRYYENLKDDFSSLSDNLVRSIFVDSIGEIWICTNKGLNRYLPESDSFRRYLHDIDDRTSISSNDVRKVFEDSDGNLWMATNGGGVNLYDRQSGTFSLISTEDGLLSNSVFGIEEDNNGNLLFITLPGISVYNRKENSFTVIDEKSGLLSNELTTGYLKASDGSLYIGGIGGVTHLPTVEQKIVDYTPTVHLNSFSVLGIPYHSGDGPIWTLDEVTLQYKENTFAFEFALSDYSSEGHNQFAYRLSGVDDDWVYSGFRNFARYTNLDPGNYTFHVIGGDSRNNWNNRGTSLKVTIKSPYWRTTFAYVTYIILFLLFILLILFRIKRREYETLNKIEEQKALNTELENRVRKRTAQIEESKRIAEEAMRAKSLFLANMSHELRTPLNAVVGFSELLNEQDYSPEKRHIITSIKTAGKSLSTLINDLLDLSKMEAGKMTINTAPVEISRVLFEIRHIFDLRLKEKNLQLILNIDPAIPRELMIDETRFRQILINLTGNSIKFTEKGHVRITASLLDRKNSGYIDLKMEISDTGCGISDRDKERIFDLFWQSKSRDISKPSGTGLGLSISRNLVEMMNGTMEVESSPGEGTTIGIVFRNMAVPDQNRREMTDNRSAGLEMQTFKGVKALIVDDVADNRNLLLEIMNQMNIRSIPAENGREALDKLKKDKPDIIFMDLQMPVMDGYTATEEIKKRKDWESIPVIAVTAALESELFGEEGPRTNFFSDYITKPYSIKSIREVVARFVGHKVKILSGSFSGESEHYDRKEIDDPDNLLIKLEEFREEWKGLKPSGRISRLESFGERLREVGKRHNARVLTEYAEVLLTFIKLFDLKGIEKHLALFPELINDLNS